ncbi:MAG: cysteine--tRNA ligase, partial [Anaerolineales bacterium]
AERYTREYDQHLGDLNILRATVNPRATQEMETIINMVQNLVAKDYAYEVDGDVYFRVERDADYGKLSGRRLDDMQAGARISVDERKENPMDFALWKAAKPGEPAWESPWGQGRPGWHIECSAMNLTHLGEQIDIHGGGNDLIFPHHENEIAQTESLTDKPFARYWMHNGMLQLSGEKMSKSVGNLITIEEFLSKHDGDALRMLVLNSSYRNPLTYNDEVVEQTNKALERLRSGLRPAQPASQGAPQNQLAALAQQVEKTEAGFVEAMDDDFNTAGALGHMFELVRTINQARDAGASDAELSAAQTTLLKLGDVLGLRLVAETKTGGQAEPFVDLLLEIRAELRQQKLWALSDLIRDRLVELGVVIEDSRSGSAWHWQD